MARNPAAKAWLEWDSNGTGPEIRESSAGTLKDLVAQAGFSRADWYGDWEGGPLDPDTSREIIVVARAE